MAALTRGAAVLAAVALLVPALRGGDRKSRRDLAQSSLEELMSIEVSSVGRKEQRLSQAAAAVYVITADDIRRSGMTSIPELLRLAPGVNVARIDASHWAISARGFNGRFANKMLVLIDGRSVYNNLFAGVSWDENDVLLDEVERIEVIRGPGATMWGANAVNGVINVITKPASATEGARVTAGTGTDDLATASVQVGGKAGKQAHYRLFTKTNKTNDSLNASGGNAGDRGGQTRGGARVDWDVSERDTLTFHGDVYRGGSGQLFAVSLPLTPGQVSRDNVEDNGGYVLGRWQHTGNHGSEFALQAYVNRNNRYESLWQGHFATVDLDFQHRLQAGGRHDVTWGLGYRRLGASSFSEIITLSPPSRADNLYSSFLQDDISLIDDRLTLSLGSKIQHNAYTGFEYQPSVRLLWSPNTRRSWWVAASRAVRTPARRDVDLKVRYEIPLEDGSILDGEVRGSRDFRSEVEHAYEAGFRTQATRRLSLDVAAFYSRYAGLQGYQNLAPRLDTSTVPPRVVYPSVLVNNGNGATSGVETSLTYNVRSNWKLAGSHSWLNFRQDVASGAGSQMIHTDTAPRHQLQARSSLDLTPRVRFETMAFYAGALNELDVPAYLRLDANVSLRLTRNLELSVGGRNLLDDRHREFVSEEYVRSTEMRRSVWVRLKWKF